MTANKNIEAHKIALNAIRATPHEITPIIIRTNLLASIRATYNANFEGLPLAFEYASETTTTTTTTTTGNNTMTTNTTTTLLTTSHTITIFENGKPRAAKYTLIKPHKVMNVFFDFGTLQLKFYTDKDNAPHANGSTIGTAYAQTRDGLSIVQFEDYIKRGIVRAQNKNASWDDLLTRFKIFSDLRFCAANWNEERYPLNVIARDLLQHTQSVAFLNGTFYSHSYRFNFLKWETILKTYNLKNGKTAKFFDELESELNTQARQLYRLQIAETRAEALEIYGKGYSRNPYGTSCMSLDNCNGKSDQVSENIADALEATVIMRPAPHLTRSFNLVCVRDAQTDEPLIRAITRASEKKRGDYARCYYAHPFTESLAAKVLEMFDCKRVESTYYGALFAKVENEHGNILALYCDDSENRDNIRERTLHDGSVILQYGGTKGEKIGAADTTTGTLSGTWCDFEEHPRHCCDHCGYEIEEDDERFDDDGNVYHSECYWENFTTCEDCDETTAIDDVYSVEVYTGGRLRSTEYLTLCSCCIDEYFTPPHANETVYYRRDFIRENMGYNQKANSES